MKWSLGALVVFVVGYTTLQAVSLGWSWASLDRVTLDATSTSAPPDTAATAPATTATPTDPPEPKLPEPPPVDTSTTTTHPPATTPRSTTTTLPGEDLLSDATSTPSVMALVGSDSREGLEDTDDFGDFPGRRADVIVLAMRDGEQLIFLSVPRDLYVEDLCAGGRHRIGEALQGCGDTRGLPLLVHELEHVTGLEIDHLAAVDLAAFLDVVDALGGYEICTDYSVRDRKSGLRLQPGCTLGDGETTLQWLRSRYTERRVDGSWETVPAVSDLTRNTRQRQFLTDIFERVAGRNDPRAILDLIETVAPHLTVDDQLSLTDAASWLWDLRDAEVSTPEIPVAYERTAQGASVLVPTIDVEEFVADIPS
jgi:LCP family protein required for cell wall assembly